MKYRRLSLEELQELEKEFVRFLASHSIPADDWDKMKSQDPDRAEGLIEIFSDIVFDKILSKVEYLEHRQKNSLRIYKVEDDKISMIGLVTDGASELDFTKNESPEEMMAQLQMSQRNLRMFAGEKKHKFLKEKEVFLLMEEGALISKDPALYRQLNALRPKS